MSGMSRKVTYIKMKIFYGFLFRSEILFRTTRELEYYFFPGFNNSLYDTKTESDFFFHTLQPGSTYWDRAA
jgi:hypothetical protein